MFIIQVGGMLEGRFLGPKSSLKVDGKNDGHSQQRHDEQVTDDTMLLAAYLKYFVRITWLFKVKNLVSCNIKISTVIDCSSITYNHS